VAPREVPAALVLLARLVHQEVQADRDRPAVATPVRRVVAVVHAITNGWALHGCRSPFLIHALLHRDRFNPSVFAPERNRRVQVLISGKPFTPAVRKFCDE